MPSSVDARLAVIADHVDRYRDEIAEIAGEPGLASSEDLVRALYEAERALRSATRALVLARTIAR
ncbi:MAG: hypothetical protein JWM12_2877 [Ilumatobacteraceae bacterium]|nr:hypothetical protein [Ilumatobacteraceae bacterium]